MNFNGINIQTFFICLIPIALVTGPFLPDFLCVLVALYFLYNSIKFKEWSYLKHPWLIIFLLWCLYLILRSIFSKDPILSLESSLFYFRFGIFAMAVWYTLEKNPNLIRVFTYLFSTVFFVVIIDGYIQYFTGQNILGFTLFYNRTGDAHRLSGFFNEQLILGSYLARLLPLLFALILLNFSHSKFFIILSMLLLILTDVLVYISGERSAFFYLLLFSIMIVIFLSKWRKLRIITIIISFIIITIITLTNEKVKNRMISQTIQQTNIETLFNDNKKSISKEIPEEKIKFLKNQTKTRAFLSGELDPYEAGIIGNKIIAFSWHHQRHYESALKMFKEYPIFGIGPKLFRLRCNEEKFYIEYGCSSHPHNFYIQLLSETGIIGFTPVFICFLLIIFFFFKKLFFKNEIQQSSKNKYNDFNICILIGVLISLWPLIPTGSIFNNWLGVIIFLPIGFLLFGLSKKQI